ncbi:cyclase family protein [Thermoactinospora rubra]|uniref:cyclase family protein n=1 Tax=Thermoactinospora rubra TaxID=1088767 RepID=UPI000A12228F|nr:cyclase family protein [Thermoactinospora rubra]
MELIDLSVPIESGMPVYPGDPEVLTAPALTVASDGVNVLAVHLGSQSGTHVDAPYHIDDSLPRLDDLPLDRFTGPAVAVDARGRPPRSPLEAALFAEVPEDVIVLVATGWSARWGTYGYAEHPFLSEEAARVLVSRRVRAVGIDALSVDPTPAHDFPAHRVLCGAHVVIAENLANLTPVLTAQAAGRSLEAWLLPIRLAGADGAPVRAVCRVA